ncbi:anti-sigma factor family protein [Methylobacterium durans]|uniref:Anti-sigma factor n=1 Tax=Methylobacterium durans TaxID=2202825 RepID=A0A2U8WHB6_9HYPH|nr:anti-sigma factor [Methylobacterium durans]AWN44716.1 anti-sigma factor [Methylobacterium durans]
MRWETLNAYVDGELDARARRGVAEAARRDPDVAAQVATLSRLKRSVRAAAPDSARSAARAPLPAARASGLGGRLGWAAAALAVILGGGLWLRQEAAAPGDPAVRAFTAWAEARPVRGSRAPTGSEAAAPDLRAAGFTLTYLSAAGAGSQLAGYEGPHGCRLALWMGPPAGMAADVVAGEGGHAILRLVSWEAGGRRYVALSDGMEAQRFALVAAAIEQALRAPDPDRLRLAMDQAAGMADRPCLG